MRLKEFEIQTIKKAVHSLDPDAAIYLFGSGADRQFLFSNFNVP